MFQNLIELRIYEHTIDPKTTQSRRLALEMDLIEQVRNNGGRFLKWEIDKRWWVNIDAVETATSTSTTTTTTTENNNTNSNQQEAVDKEILSKVHYAFRDFRKKMRKSQQELIVNASSTHAFKQQQDGQKRARCLQNKNDKSATTSVESLSDCENGGCVRLGGNGDNNNRGFGYFFSTYDGSYLDLKSIGGR